jgi:hypothetical protein
MSHVAYIHLHIFKTAIFLSHLCCAFIVYNSATALANDGLIDDAVPLYLHVSVLISLLLCRYFGNTFC